MSGRHLLFREYARGFRAGAKRKFLTVDTCIIALFSVDLACEDYSLPPCGCCMGNPIRFVDPNGGEGAP